MLPRLPSKPSICNIATKYCSTLDRVGNQWFKGITFIFCIAALWNVMQGAYNSQQNTTNEFQLIDKPHIVIVEEQQKSKYSRASATAGESKPVAIESRPSGLDFAVAGFPKTGTTYLLRLLESHPEIVMTAVRGILRNSAWRWRCTNNGFVEVVVFIAGKIDSSAQIWYQVPGDSPQHKYD